MKDSTKAGWARVLREGFVRLVFYRGMIQVGLLGAFVFIFLQFLFNDQNLAVHAVKALIFFPLGGLIFGATFWCLARLLDRDSGTPGSDGLKDEGP